MLSLPWCLRQAHNSYTPDEWNHTTNNIHVSLFQLSVILTNVQWLWAKNTWMSAEKSRLGCREQQSEIWLLASECSEWDSWMFSCTAFVQLRPLWTICLYRRLFTSCSPTSTLQLYRSLVHPHLEYACQVWTPHTAKAIGNRCAQVCT